MIATCASAPSTAGSPGRCRAARCTSPTTRTPPSPACSPSTAASGTGACSTCSASRPVVLPRARRLVGRRRRGDRAPRQPADRLPRRRPAGVARRPGLRRAGAGQDHVRHGRHARRLQRGRSRRRRPSAASTAPTRSSRGPAAASLTWGAEAIMLSAGTNVEWLRDDLGLIATSAESHDVAASVRRQRRRALRAGAARPRARRTGTTAPAARCSGSPGARPAPTSCAPCWKASPIAAPTWSRRPRPTPACRSPRCGSTAG